MAHKTQQVKEAIQACTNYVRDAILPNNPESAVSEAERIIWLLYREDPATASMVREHAFVQFVAKLIDAERRQSKKSRSRANPAQLRLPGFEALPVYIEVFNERVALRKAVYHQVREFLSVLIRKHRAEAEKDLELQQARALVAKMKAYPERAATVERVLGL